MFQELVQKDESHECLLLPSSSPLRTDLRYFLPSSWVVTLLLPFQGVERHPFPKNLLLILRPEGL